MNAKTYGIAYRAAFAVTRKENADIRIAKDKANAVGSVVAMIADGTLTENDLRKRDAATEAALAAVR